MHTPFIVLLAIASSPLLFSDSLPSNSELLASYRSDGSYNLIGLGSWNGGSVTAANSPTPYQAQLAATINFYGVTNDPDKLLVQVTDVITTNGSSWWGLAFDNVSQTGIRFTLPSRLSLPMPTLSGKYANPGEAYLTGSGSQILPLTDTPGFGITALAGQTYDIHTVSGTNLAFGTWGYVYGAQRITGGGIFSLDFDSSKVNFFRDVDFNAATVESVYGAYNQFIPASLVDLRNPTPVPEISSLGMLSGVAALMVVSLRRRRSSRVFLAAVEREKAQ